MRITIFAMMKKGSFSFVIQRNFPQTKEPRTMAPRQEEPDVPMLQNTGQRIKFTTLGQKSGWNLRWDMIIYRPY